MLSIVCSCGIFVITPAYIEEKTTFRKCLMSKQFFRIYLPSVFMHTSADIASEVSDELLYGTTVRKISPPIPAKNQITVTAGICTKNISVFPTIPILTDLYLI